MVATNELLRRGTGPHRTDVALLHATDGHGRFQSLRTAPLHEMWWFTDAGSLIVFPTGATLRAHGTVVQPGTPAAITLHDATGQQDVLGAHPLAARLTTFSKDNVEIARLQAFSEEASIDWVLEISATGTDPRLNMASYKGQVHDVTAVHIAFDDPQRVGVIPRNVPLDDGSRAWAEAPTLSHTADLAAELDSDMALIDVAYSHYDGAGRAALVAHVDGGDTSWSLVTNNANMANVEKMSGHSNAGSAIGLLNGTYMAYGRMTCAQMDSGKWQCWLRCHSEDHRYVEALFVVTPASPTVPPSLRLASLHASTAAFVHTIKRYRK